MVDHSVTEDVYSVTRHFDGSCFRGRSFLVTGGAGFLGSWVCECLIELGGKVTCLDNMSTGLHENVEHLLSNPDFVFLRRDVTEELPGVFDYVLHMASIASTGEYRQHPVDTLLSNSLGTRNALDVAKRSGGRLLFASTSELYGDAATVPTPETYYGNLDPNDSRSCYREGKRFGEILCEAYRHEYAVDTRIARIFNSYGPRLRGDGTYARVVSAFLTRALANDEMVVYGDGLQTRSFCYVSDTVRGILSLLVNRRAAGETVNIGNPQEMTILELARLVKRIVGSQSRIVHLVVPGNDIRRRCPDISKASELLGWKPEVTIEEGLRKTLIWLRHLDRPF
jgi:UDP-glucuronate decarboxylase